MWCIITNATLKQLFEAYAGGGVKSAKMLAAELFSPTRFEMSIQRNSKGNPKEVSLPCENVGNLMADFDLRGVFV